MVDCVGFISSFQRRIRFHDETVILIGVLYVHPVLLDLHGCRSGWIDRGSGRILLRRFVMIFDRFFLVLFTCSLVLAGFIVAMSFGCASTASGEDAVLTDQSFIDLATFRTDARL